MKKYKIMYVFVALLFFLIIPTTIYATNDINTIIGNMKNVGQVTTGDTKVKSVINSVIKLVQIAGTGVALIMVTFLGIKYMIASSGEKADIKKQAVPIIIGCVLLFAAVNIVGIIASFGDGLN